VNQPYTRDPNEIAREFERKERAYEEAESVVPVRVTPTSPPGTLTIWSSLWDLSDGKTWQTQSLRTRIQVKESGVIIAYDERGDAEIFYPQPGWYVNFVPDREGE
jgi:hypothetical protein